MGTLHTYSLKLHSCDECMAECCKNSTEATCTQTNVVCVAGISVWQLALVPWVVSLINFFDRYAANVVLELYKKDNVTSGQNPFYVKAIYNGRPARMGSR